MLFRPDAFEALTDAPWDAGRVRERVRELVADVDSAFDAEGLWPAEGWDSWRTPTPLTTLYVGAAGVVWALEELRVREHAETGLDLAGVARSAVERWRERPDFMAGVELPEPRASGLLSGQTGILLVAYRLTRDGALADELLARVRENTKNEAEDVMWGTPGTLVAARLMHEWTSDRRWRATCDESAEALLSRRDDDGLWTQHLHGERFRGLGPPHGLVGNVQALLPLLDRARADALARDTAAVLRRTAFREDRLANWPYDERRELAAADGQIRVQWCAGAPGIVSAAAGYLDEDLLLAGAELVWEAGPPTLEKGAGICHGTAGNGYALLAAFARTGDERWLARARRFAVHALEQVERLREQRGRGRYSLWTGDLGVTLFAAACLEARTEYPLLGAPATAPADTSGV